MEKVKKILSQLTDANLSDLEQLSTEEAEDLAGGTSAVDVNISCGPHNTGCGPNTSCAPKPAAAATAD